MSDNYSKQVVLLDSPAVSAEAVTPGTPLAATSRSIYIGGDGNISVRFAKTGANVTFVGVTAGMFLPVRVDLVHANTTATNIVSLI